MTGPIASIIPGPQVAQQPIDEAVLQAAISAYFAANPPHAVPSGTFIWFCGAEAPVGYLECDGRAVSRTEYAALFAVIGVLYGAGDGSTTFNLPNSKDFIRGRDPNSGRNVGDYHEDQIKAHTHDIRGGGGSIPDWFGGSTAPYGMRTSGGQSYSGYIQSTGGDETFPKHLVLMGCIKV